LAPRGLLPAYHTAEHKSIAIVDGKPLLWHGRATDGLAVDTTATINTAGRSVGLLDEHPHERLIVAFGEISFDVSEVVRGDPQRALPPAPMLE